MSEIEHFQNGIALIRDAMEIPKEIIDELLVISKGQWEHQYVVEGNEVINKASGTRTPIEFHGQDPIRVQVHSPPVIPQVEFWDDFWREAADVCYAALLQYIEKYPMILSQLWWCNRGHALVYDAPMGHLFGHHDNDCGYSFAAWDDIVGKSELSTHNVVSTTLHLVDTPDGGGVTFPYADNLHFPCRAGDILLFPANYLGAHEIEYVNEGHRMSYLTFYCQGSNEPLRIPPNAEQAEINFTEHQTDASLTWCDTIDTDFMEASGWSLKRLDKEHPNWLQRGPGEPWGHASRD